ncbi:MAG TPA: hypothetical protein VGO25_04365 [Rhodanobacteraceae bacterium]|jgi:hypothetical protein|nr:hypothetical protein [Rhodanobacteraceae bacterium]
MRRNPAVFAILVGGGIAGALDITYAIVWSAIRGVSATVVLQSVASGLLGQPAYEGGAPTAVLGFCLHFGMAFLIAAIFYFASRKLAFMTERAVVAGLLYGICVYVVMNFVVLPLSAFPTPLTFTPIRVLINVVAHMILFGLPIALATRAASARASV